MPSHGFTCAKNARLFINYSVFFSHSRDWKNREKDDFKINKIAPKKQYFNGITESFRGIFRVTGISVVTIITIDFYQEKKKQFSNLEKSVLSCAREPKKNSPGDTALSISKMFLWSSYISRGNAYYRRVSTWQCVLTRTETVNQGCADKIKRFSFLLLVAFSWSKVHLIHDAKKTE